MINKNNNIVKNNEIKRLPLKSDYVFKRIFASEENNSILKAFLEAVLDTKIKNVEVKNPELTPDMADEKLGILDIKVDIDGKKIVDVEMQVSNEYNFRQRTMTYISKLASEQLKAGNKYEMQKEIIAINILNFSYLDRNAYHSVAEMRYRKTKPEEYVELNINPEEEVLTDTFEVHFIELEKFKKKNPDCSTKLAQWLWLIEGSEEKMAEAAKENKEVKKAIDELEKISLSPEERQRYEDREWAIMRYNSEVRANYEHGHKAGEEFGKKQGIEIGEAKGKKEEKLAVAKKLKEMNLSVEQIMQATELTKEEIEKL